MGVLGRGRNDVGGMEGVEMGWRYREDGSRGVK